MGDIRRFVATYLLLLLVGAVLVEAQFAGAFGHGVGLGGVGGFGGLGGGLGSGAASAVGPVATATGLAAAAGLSPDRGFVANLAYSTPFTPLLEEVIRIGRRDTAFRRGYGGWWSSVSIRNRFHVHSYDTTMEH